MSHGYSGLLAERVEREVEKQDAIVGFGQATRRQRVGCQHERVHFWVEVV